MRVWFVPRMIRERASGGTMSRDRWLFLVRALRFVSSEGVPSDRDFSWVVQRRERGVLGCHFSCFFFGVYTLRGSDQSRRDFLAARNIALLLSLLGLWLFSCFGIRKGLCVYLFLYFCFWRIEDNLLWARRSLGVSCWFRIVSQDPRTLGLVWVNLPRNFLCLREIFGDPWDWVELWIWLGCFWVKEPFIDFFKLVIFVGFIDFCLDYLGASLRRISRSLHESNSSDYVAIRKGI